MGIKLAAASGGSVELVPTNTASNFTVTVPAVTGTAVLQNASNNLLMNSGYGSDAVAYGCRAWVNFNGTGTVAIRASGNVSSITDNGTGAYVVNFTSALSDNNFAVTADCSGTSFVRLNTLSTGSIDITTLGTNTVNGQDTATVCLAIFR